MRQGEGRKSKRRVTSKNSLFLHHHPNFYDFFPRAIAPFTGIRGAEIRPQEGRIYWVLYSRREILNGVAPLLCFVAS